MTFYLWTMILANKTAPCQKNFQLLTASMATSFYLSFDIKRIFPSRNTSRKALLYYTSTYDFGNIFTNNDIDDNNNNNNSGTGLPHAQGYYDNDVVLLMKACIESSRDIIFVFLPLSAWITTEGISLQQP